jgi:hypothetical protein
LEEEYEKWGLKIWKNGIRYRSLRGIENQWEYNNPTVKHFKYLRLVTQ